MGSIQHPSASSKKYSITPVQIEELRAKITDSTLLTPSSDGYAEAINRWAASAVKPAGAVLLAKSETDISTAVVFAATRSIDVAVRGGGHSTSGSSSSDGGLVIDLSPLRSTSVDLSSTPPTITAGGGCVWADVNNAAYEHKLATPGGTANDTGIGGLTLGGGYGYLTSRHGLVVDNLVACRVVLASGEVVMASKTENADLFWALRGAGHNFGVVTAFTYRLHPQPNDVWTGTMAFHASKIAEIVEFANRHAEKRDADSPIGVILAGSSNPESGDPIPLVVMMVFHNGPEERAREIFGPLLALGPIANTTAQMPYPQANELFATAPGSTPMRRRVRPSAFLPPISVDFATHTLSRFQEMLNEVPDAANGSLIAWEYFDQSSIASEREDDMAFANRSATEAHNTVVGLSWTKEENDAKCREWTRALGADMLEELEKEMKERGIGVEEGTATDKGLVYVNNTNSSDVSPSNAFGNNYPRLQILKGKYDPGNVFNKTLPIEPVLSG